MEQGRSSLKSTLARTFVIGNIVVGAVSLGDSALFHLEENSLRSEHAVAAQARAEAYDNGSDYLNVQGKVSLSLGLVGGACLLLARRRGTSQV